MTKFDKWIRRISKAIRKGRFNFEYGTREWYGIQITVGPVFSSYGKIGYSVMIDNGRYGELEYDQEMGKLVYSKDCSGVGIDIWSNNI